jgi:general nucleoside transport system permease protein
MANPEFIWALIAGIAIAATPLLFAALGELVVEKAGVLNLGVEGMMIIGAISGFSMILVFDSYIAGFSAAIVSGMAMSLLFGVLTQKLRSNQVATGLALTMFGLGISALVGQAYTGKSVSAFPRFAGFDVFAILAVSLAIGVHIVLNQTRLGLILRAVGENHEAAHNLGYAVVRIRLAAIAFGGAMAGLGGAYLSLVQTPFWAERMTAGRGWIALALVVFAAWRPGRLVAGAYLFGGISILQLHAQGLGLKVDALALSMLPYLATIVVLVLMSRNTGRYRDQAPASLGQMFSAPR